MAMQFTVEQQKVIDTRGKNLLISAAAGSGKTAVLVERIIKMVTDRENPISIDELLVVTFTNAAASEMRERITDALEKSGEKEGSKNMHQQIALMPKANIMTIHAFCLNVIKSYYHLIGIDPNIRIADSTELELVKEEVMPDGRKKFILKEKKSGKIIQKYTD